MNVHSCFILCFFCFDDYPSCFFFLKVHKSLSFSFSPIFQTALCIEVHKLELILEVEIFCWLWVGSRQKDNLLSTFRRGPTKTVFLLVPWSCYNYFQTQQKPWFSFSDTEEMANLNWYKFHEPACTSKEIQCNSWFSSHRSNLFGLGLYFHFQPFSNKDRFCSFC